jgi:hypothetical protein
LNSNLHLEQFELVFQPLRAFLDLSESPPSEHQRHKKRDCYKRELHELDSPQDGERSL